MLFLPEMALLLDRDRARSVAHITSEAASPWPARLAAIAAESNLWLHAGSAPFLSDDGSKRVNRSLVFAPDGRLAARYDKVHMFDVDLPGGESWRESASYAGGDVLALVDTPAGRLGLTICFDLRFPELFAALVAGGAHIIAVPAALHGADRQSPLAHFCCAPARSKPDAILSQRRRPARMPMAGQPLATA